MRLRERGRLPRLSSPQLASSVAAPSGPVTNRPATTTQLNQTFYALSGWRLGVVVSVVGRINEVNQHRARLVHDG